MKEAIYLICGVSGVLLHSLVKMQALKQKAALVNMKFIFIKYLEDDWITILASFLTIIMLALFMPDILQLKPDVINYARILFAFAGYIGSKLIQGIFSKTAKKISDLADVQNDTDERGN